ncbi:MAG: HU family DNA-binding protein [Chloroflexota bacterium]|nr:HU family DNA-binding protein [Chloroflexota bacterium]
MVERIAKKDLIDLVVQRTSQEATIVEEIVDATLEEIYEALKRGESVSLRNFGTFYVRVEWQSWVFKFTPSQRLRRVFGWSSTYTGPL